MAKLIRLAMAGLLLAVFSGAFATSNVTLLYRGGGEGKVVFDGQLHASRGYRCNDCHTEYKKVGALFTTHKTARIDMATHSSGTQCFACHDGATAPNQCDGCHRKVTGF